MEEPDELAIFPLSSVVLFPGVQTPLHLFEPRYRQMAEETLAGERRIGMVTVPPEHVGAMAGDPPVYPVGCGGRIAQHQKLPDGRFNIVLEGRERFRIVAETERPARRLYRVARIEPLADPYPDEERGRVGELRQRIVALVGELVQRSDPERTRQLTPGLFEGVEDAAFVNSLCNAFAFPTEEKQGLLEAATIPQRFERLEGLLSFHLAELATPGGAGSGNLH